MNQALVRHDTAGPTCGAALRWRAITGGRVASLTCRPHTACMVESLLPLLIVLALLYLWQSALRTRERARALGNELCAQAGVQLLDQTVALKRLRVRRLPGHGLQLWRCYGFELSTNGTDRQRGSLDLVAGEVVAYDLPPAATAAHAGGDSTGGNNVIELRPLRRN